MSDAVYHVVCRDPECLDGESLHEDAYSAFVAATDHHDATGHRSTWARLADEHPDARDAHERSQRRPGMDP